MKLAALPKQKLVVKPSAKPALKPRSVPSARALALQVLSAPNPHAKGYSDALIMEIATQAVKEERAKRRHG